MVSCRHLAKAAAFAFVAALLAPGAGAEPVATRAAVHEDFGRIVFDWPEEVGFETSVEDGTLRISFSRPLETDLGPVSKRLEGYVTGASVGSDGRSVSIVLARPLETRVFKVEKNKVVVDLTAATPAAGGTSPVRIRVGEHPGFTRVVFDWLRIVEYTVRREGDEARITFAVAGAVDLSELQGSPPPFVRWAKLSRQGSSATVSLGLVEDARLRNFRHGTKIVLDVLASPGERRSTPPAARADAPMPKVIAPPPVGRDAPGPPRRLLLPPAPAKDTAEATAPAPPPAPAPPAPAKDTAEATPPAPPARPAEAAASSPSSPDGNEAGAAALRVTVLESPDVTRLSFSWKIEAAAAVFERAGFLWVVFDRPASADLSMIRPQPEGVVVAAEQVANPSATVLRFQIRPGLFPIVRRLGTVWFLDLTERPVVVTEAIEVEPQPYEASGARLFLPLVYLGQRVEVSDPEVGDRLIVVPISPPVRAVVAGRDFIEVKVLATAHGVAVVPKADDLEVEVTNRGVAITRETGLMLSGRQAGLGGGAERAIRSAAPRPLILDFAAWRRGPIGQYNEIRQSLLRAISDAPVDSRNQARLELARFHLAHRFAADSQAVLAGILDRDPEVANNPSIRAMRGAINFLLNRLDVAAKEFSHRDFNGIPEMANWRGAVAASRAKWREAHEAFALGLGAVDTYPADLRHEFELLEVRAAMETGDFDRVEGILDMLLAGDPVEPLRSKVMYLRGRNQEHMGQLEAALESYGAATASSYRRVRADADFARINLLLKQGELVTIEAIERLERLRFAWRGDSFELALLRQLGELYVESGNFNEGLASLRHAITYFPGNEETRAIAKRMNMLFERLFLGGGADTMGPVSALALYYEFRELTPLGPKGDDMIRRLADRLVAVDLLDRAAKLLQHQIDFRVTGGERATVGARLAVIYLLDGRPEDARKALTKTTWRPLTAGLIAERKRLQSRSLTELGRFDQALDLLVADDSEAAKVLRGEIRWREKNWAAAATAYEDLLGERWLVAEPLDAEDRQRLLKLAVSLALAGDEAGLERVRERYGRKLAKGPDADAFNVITGKIDVTGTEFRRLAGRVAQTDRLTAFMASYRDKLAQGGLSAIN